MRGLSERILFTRTLRMLLMSIYAWGGMSVGADLTYAQSVDEIHRDIEGFNRYIVQLEDRFLNPALLESHYRLETRYNDAKVTYMLGDYERASVLFVDLLENPRIRQLESYREVLFLLGNSLYHLRNHRAAREYLRRLTTLGDGPHYQDAVMLLLQIASSTGDYDGVDALYKQLNSLQDISPELVYMRAKTLYHQKRYSEAQQWFERSAKDQQYAFIASYYKAIAMVANKQLEQAREVFDDISQRTPSNIEERRVVDLSLLALGRLAYEMGDFDAANSYYIRVPRTSRYFERALYELTWALISKGNYRAARNNVELLLLAQKDATFVPEARLLLADLAMREGDDEYAQKAFQNLIETFSPAREGLLDFINTHDDIEAYFVDLVYKGIEQDRPSFLPEMVEGWAERSPLLDNATQLVTDVVMTKRDIDEAYAMILEIEARINSGARAESFPMLAQGLALGIELENQMIDSRQRLVDREYDIIAPYMNADEKKLWAEYEQESQTIRQQLAQMPRTFEAMQHRSERVSSEFRRLRYALDEIGQIIEGQRVELAGINAYLQDNPLNLTAEERQKLNGMRDIARDTINTLERERVALRREVDQVSRQLGIGDEVSSGESDIRQEYLKMLDARISFLLPMHTRVQPDQRSQLNRIKEARNRLPAIEGRLGEFFRSMNSIIDERVQEIRQVIRQERDALASHQSQLQAVTTESESAAAGIAYLNFLRVGNQFDTIVQRGEVGLIDVGWRRKEAISTQIRQVFEDRASEIRLLQESFQDVR